MLAAVHAQCPVRRKANSTVHHSDELVAAMDMSRRPYQVELVIQKFLVIRAAVQLHWQ